MNRVGRRKFARTDAIKAREGQQLLGSDRPLPLLDRHESRPSHAERGGRRILGEVSPGTRATEPLTEFGGSETAHSWPTISRTHDRSGSELMKAPHSA